MNTNLESLNDMVGRLTEMAKKLGWQEPPVLRCEHCGDTEDVALEHVHVGGIGDDVPRYYCKDRVSCFARWNKQHGIEVLTK